MKTAVLDSVSVGPTTLTQTIITVIKVAQHKLTCGELVFLIQKLIPTATSNSVSRILTRLIRTNKYNIYRTAERPFLYYYHGPLKKVSADFEFEEFWDPNLPLHVHRILIVGSGLSITKTERLVISFMDHSEKIIFNFNANTKKIRIDFKCSKWLKSLNCHDFKAFVVALETVLELNGLPNTLDKFKVVNVDFNQDIEYTRISGAKYVSVQAFSNALLIAYNKGTGYRKELQFNRLNVPPDMIRKQLSRKSSELKYATVFEKQNTLLNQLQLSHNQQANKLNTFCDYSNNLLNEFDLQLNQVHNVVQNLTTVNLQLAMTTNEVVASQVQTVDHLVIQSDMLRDHDSNVTRRLDQVEDTIELTQTPRKTHVRSGSIQDKILEQLEKGQRTTFELTKLLGLPYHKINYHIKKLENAYKICFNPAENVGVKGRKNRLYKLLGGDN